MTTEAEIAVYYQRHGELAMLLVERTATAHEVVELLHIRRILEGVDAVLFDWPSHYNRRTEPS